MTFDQRAVQLEACLRLAKQVAVVWPVSAVAVKVASLVVLGLQRCVVGQLLGRVRRRQGLVRVAQKQTCRRRQLGSLQRLVLRNKEQWHKWQARACLLPRLHLKAWSL